MKKILIVEDDKMLSNGIVLSLQNSSYEFYSAYTLADAKNQINKQAFDLIVLDINLLDGSEEAKTITFAELNRCSDMASVSPPFFKKPIYFRLVSFSFYGKIYKTIVDWSSQNAFYRITYRNRIASS